MFKLDLEKAEEPEIIIIIIDFFKKEHRKSKRVPGNKQIYL